MQSGTRSRPYNNCQLREENRGGFRIIELHQYVVICRERGFSQMMTKNGQGDDKANGSDADPVGTNAHFSTEVLSTLPIFSQTRDFTKYYQINSKFLVN